MSWILDLGQAAPAWTATIAVLAGLCLGSFAGMLAYRLPRGLPLDKPGSFCPECRAPLRWRSNLPLVAFLAQRGRCSQCRGRIHWRYPLAEALCGLLGLAAWSVFGMGLEAVAALVVCVYLVTLALIDFEHGLLPDRLTLSLLWAGLAFSLVPKLPLADGLVRAHFPGPSQAIAGAIAGYAFLWLVNYAWRKFRNRDGLGAGDCKLLAAMGAWVGFDGLPLVLAPAAITGALVGLLLIARGRASLSDPIPFGPFLAAGGALALFLGPEIGLMLARSGLPGLSGA